MPVKIAANRRQFDSLASNSIQHLLTFNQCLVTNATLINFAEKKQFASYQKQTVKLKKNSPKKTKSFI